MNPLLTLLLRSIAGKAFQKAPEGSALNLWELKWKDMIQYQEYIIYYKMLQ
jgi:hypothetical protein